MLPRVAFITINFNSFFDTVELLESIDEDGVDLDLYILDNGSTLDDYNKLKKYLDGYSVGPIKVFLFRSECNLGFSKGNNFLLEKSGLDYDFYVVGNNDLVLSKNSINRLNKAGIRIRVFYIYFHGCVLC